MDTNFVCPTEAQLAPVQALYDQGLFQQAYQVAGSLGPLHQWTGTRGRLLAGRLARHLGADKLGTRQVLLAWRHDPDDWTARVFFLWTLGTMRGPAALWRRLKQFGDPPEGDRSVRAEVYSLRARAAFMLRDFERADYWLDEADRVNPESAWLASERSYRLEAEDRYEESLEVAQEALRVHPGNWALIDRVGRVLQLSGRDDTALEHLRASIPQNESPYLAAVLFALELELQLYDDALLTLDSVDARAPLADVDYRRWLAANRTFCHYSLGRHAEAVIWARQMGDDEFSRKFAERLEIPPPEASRVELPVGFVRQHHLTCVPATLATLGRYWGKRTEQLEVAEAICYDGTPGHSERNWASSNGWVAREFKVTLPAARLLLKRGVPFALVTEHPGTSHEQAVIGHDDYRESLLIRDPYFRNKSEILADASLKQQASTGPRGMAMVPAESAALLDGIDLPEADLYDIYHQVLLSLDRHDRDAAITARQQLDGLAPGHRITLQARRAIAFYDANSHEQLAAVDELLRLFPDNVNLQLSRLQTMRTLSRREDRLAVLREACAKKKSEPLLWQEFAGELAQDSREHRAALRWLHRAERHRHGDASALLIRGNIEWAQGRFEEACELYRFAACLNDKSEYFATTWFKASRWLKQTSEAMGFLARRFHRDGKRSSYPARTLVWAHMELDQTVEAFSSLENALALRPQDGVLKLFACDQYTNSGDLQRAETLLEEARGMTSVGASARSAAAIANQKGELQRALDLWRDVLAAEPLAMDAYRSIAFLLSERESRTAALSFLAAACGRFPFYVPLHELHLTWLRDESPPEYEQAARDLLDHHSENAWVRRELALSLVAQNRFEEAHRELDIAVQLDPNDPASFGVRGKCFARESRQAEARAQYRECLQRSIDDGFAMRELLGQCATPEQRGEALSFIQAELIRQTTFGQGILEFADLALPFLAPEQLLSLLQQAQTERSDLWQAWSALINHMVAMKRTDEALAVARNATERFPLAARLWFDLACVHRARLEHSEQLAALEQARQISPTWSYVSRQLAEALQWCGRLQEAKVVVEQTVARSRHDAFNRGMLADLLWKSGDKEKALKELRESVLLEPGYEWAWSQLEEWGQEMKQPHLRRDLAEELTRRRPGEARSWWLLANALNETDELNRCLECLDKATERNPRFVAAWRSRATALANAGRYDDALAACRPAALDPAPPELLATAALVHAKRQDLPAAIREMRAVLADHPNIQWGWRELASWHYQRQEYTLAAQAAETISKLNPFDAIPIGFAADLKLREGKRADALKDFARAFDTDSSYTFAGFKLLELQVENKDWKAARQTLVRLQPHVKEARILEREMILEIAAGNRTAVWPLVRRLCSSADDDADVFADVAALLQKHKLGKAALPIALEALRSANPNPSAAWLWVELRVAARLIRNSKELSGLSTPSELSRRAYARQLLAVGESMERQLGWPWDPYQQEFKRMMKTHRSWFHSDDALWGKVGYALASQKRYAETIQWLGDWQKRKEVEPWMLENLLLALQQSGRDKESDDLIRAARALPRHLGSLLRFDLFDAIREAYAGNAEPGRHLLSLFDEVKMSSYDRSFMTFLRVALDFHSPKSKNIRFKSEHRRLLVRALDNTRRYCAGQRAFRQVTDLIAERTGKGWIRVWRRTRLWMPQRPGWK